LTSVILKFPGELSDWISVSDYLRREAEKSSDEKVNAWRLALAAKLAGLELRAVVIGYLEKQRLLSDGCAVKIDDPELVFLAAGVNRRWLKAGLGDLRGVENLDGHAANEDCVLDAIAASGLLGLLSDIVAVYQSLDPSERAAFFTLAPVVPNTGAAIAPTSDALSSGAPAMAPDGSRTS